MIDKLISYSIQNKLVILFFTVALILWGIISLRQLPIGAVPDITNNQVLVITNAPSLATQEIEQFITTPVELSMQNIQQLVEIRSISRFGLSVVTVVFEEKMDTYLARQLVSEHLKIAEENIPAHLGTPSIAPISTGLGEVYQYIIEPKKNYEKSYSTMDLRTIQDWIVSRQLAGIEGVVEVNTLGGHLKQYEVAVNPNLLNSKKISITEIYNALERSNENTGGAYIEKNPNTYFIRTKGVVQSLNDIENIVVKVINGSPILIKDVAKVAFGSAPRYGAITHDGKEVVGGTVMMLKGANPAEVTQRIKDRVKEIEKSLPEGIQIKPYLVRDKLINTAINTVKNNLIEGGLIVIFILVIMLGNLRASLIVASVIPLSLLFALSMMNIFGISANLMSLGAIDFGLIVDGAVIIVEAIVHRLQVKFRGTQLSSVQMNNEVTTATQNIRKSAAFGEIIILMVYLPILALVGIEGKMFRPMALTIMFAISGALLLSLTYVPMMSALFLNKTITSKKTIADRIIDFCYTLYGPILNFALRFKALILLATVTVFIFSGFKFLKLGGEFIPTLEEGDLALHQILPPGSSLSQSVEMSKIIQQKLKSNFPEIDDVVTKIGSAEIPTDPMPVETGDIMVIMKPKSEWTSARNRQEMFQKMEEVLKTIPGLGYEFSQPIQMRFNELMTGSRGDIAVKLFGNDLNLLYQKAKDAEQLITSIPGVLTTKVEQTVGLPQIVVQYKYDKLAQYGLHVKEINQVVRTAFAGEKVGTIYEEDRRFDLVVRLENNYRQNITDVKDVYVSLSNGSQIPLDAVADVSFNNGPMQISRENTNRRIVISVNSATNDVENLVQLIQNKLDQNLELPAGYYFRYGGQYENLRAAKKRLSIAVPVALGLIFILLYLTFHSIWQSLLIFTAIPLSAIGGIWALAFRDMPFSISAGIGFIALFGVAVLNGIVLIGCFNELALQGIDNIKNRIIEGTKIRLRPVLMTASVASLGFLPMALSTSGGAEVQRPLATVVIGGLITATVLTLIIIPILYSWMAHYQESKNKKKTQNSLPIILILFILSGFQSASTAQENVIKETKTIQNIVDMVIHNHPNIESADIMLRQANSMQNQKYSLGTTSITYQGDGLYNSNPQKVQQLIISQEIPNPAINRSQNKYYNVLSKQYELQVEQTKRILTLETKKICLDILGKKASIKSLESAKKILQKHKIIADKRKQLGASNQIDALNIQYQKDQKDFLINQLQKEIESLESLLAIWTQSNKPITLSDSLSAMTYSVIDSVWSLELQLAQQNINLEQSQLEILNNQSKPNFNVSYAIQDFDDGGLLNGIQLGMQLPIFKGPLKRKIKVQELKVQQKEVSQNIIKQNTQAQLLTLINDITRAKLGIEHYENLKNTILQELERIVQLNYQAGELTHLDLMHTIELSIQAEQNYIEQLLAYNQAILHYEFIVKP